MNERLAEDDVRSVASSERWKIEGARL
jgi:hypothetical protein